VHDLLDLGGGEIGELRKAFEKTPVVGITVATWVCCNMISDSQTR